MFMGKKILAVVPARGGSKGIKLKNLRPLGGVPLVALVGRVVAALPWIDRAVVSTDHSEIAAVARAAGIDAPFLRPPEISGDRISDIPVLTHALEATERDDGQIYDVVVMLQPTSPMRRPEHVERTLHKLVEGHFDAVWTVSPTDSKGHPLKQLVLTGDSLDYYAPTGADIIARQQLSPVYHRNGVAYALTRQCLLENGSLKGERTAAVVIEEPMVNIDTEFDLLLAEFLMTTSPGRGQQPDGTKNSS